MYINKTVDIYNILLRLDPIDDANPTCILNKALKIDTPFPLSIMEWFKNKNIETYYEATVKTEEFLIQ